MTVVYRGISIVIVETPDGYQGMLMRASGGALPSTMLHSDVVGAVREARNISDAYLSRRR